MSPPIAVATADVLLVLAPEPTAPARARRALAEARVPEDLESTVELLATELIANAVRHAGLQTGQRITFAARYAGDHIRVEVHDPGPGFDVAKSMGGTGHGLRMLDKLASRWGAETGDDGTRVWFELDRRSRRRFYERD